MNLWRRFFSHIIMSLRGASFVLSLRGAQRRSNLNRERLPHSLRSLAMTRGERLPCPDAYIVARNDKAVVVLLIIFCFILNFSLYAQTYKMDVVVEASKNDSEIADLQVGVQVITGDEIEKLNPQTIDDILNYQTGITEAGKQGEIGSNSTVRIRGNGSNYSLVLLDGQPINSSSLGSADLSFIDVDMIDRIEIIKGPYSTVLGNGAVGGVLNIITKSGYLKSSEKFGGYIKAAAGSYGYNNLAVNNFLNVNNTSLALNFDLGNYGGFRENSGYDSKNIFLKLNQEVREESNFGFRYIYNTKNIGNPGNNPTAIEDYDGVNEKISNTPNDKMKFNNQYLQADYNIIKDDLGGFDFRFYNNIDEKMDKDPDVHFDLWQFSPKDDFFRDIKYGFETKFESNNKWLVGYQIEYDEAKNTDNFAKLDIYDYSRRVHSLYLQKTMKKDKWTNIIGGRYDYTSSYGEGFSPKLTSIFNLNDNVRLSANIAKSFRILSFSEIYYTSNSLKYKYEDGWGGDFGIDFALFEKKADLQVVYFRQEINNKISWADWMNPKQLQESQSEGIETKVDFQIGIFENTINYTYTDAKFRETRDSPFLRDLYVPYHKFSYNFGGEIDNKILFDIAAKYTGEQKWEDSYGWEYRLAEYWIFDLNLTKKFEKFDIYFSVDNIFDEDYQYRIGYPTVGREFRIGTKFRF